jgi:hypothetical protein
MRRTGQVRQRVGLPVFLIGPIVIADGPVEDPAASQKI